MNAPLVLLFDVGRALIASGGAGRRKKMVHRGIEYGLLQSDAGGYEPGSSISSSGPGGHEVKEA